MKLLLSLRYTLGRRSRLSILVFTILAFAIYNHIELGFFINTGPKKVDDASKRLTVSPPNSNLPPPTPPNSNIVDVVIPPIDKVKPNHNSDGNNASVSKLDLEANAHSCCKPLHSVRLQTQPPIDMCLHTFSLDKSSNDPNAVVLDIGANIGTHTLFLGNAGYKVHAFEPMLANFNLLNCSASSNEVLKRNVVLNNFGLGTKTGKSCIAPEENENFGSAKIKEADKCAPKNVIEIRRLDEYLDKHKIKPYLIKVDVEGYEYKALLPALEHFKNDPPAHIFTEFAPSHLRDAGDVPEQYLTFFYNLGYKLDWEHGATNIKRGGKEYMSLLFLKQGNYNLHWYR